MEYHTEDPAREPKVAKHQIVLPEGIAGGNVLADFSHAMVMRQEIKEREEH